MLNIALLPFDVVKRGTVGVSTLSDIRTAAHHQRPETFASTCNSNSSPPALYRVSYSRAKPTGPTPRQTYII